MKYRGARVLPPSVAVWLEQQLEERGIDSLVYTHYILTLLEDQSNEIDTIPSFSKVSKTISNNWKNCNLQELKKSAVNSLADLTSQQDIEGLVDELCDKLKEVNSDFGNCLKEKTNSEDLFNLVLPVCTPPDHSSKCFSVFPTSNRENIANENCSLIEKSVWTKNICRTLGRRKDSESSPKENKISKRKEGKENAKGRMRSRSTVKSQSSMRSRSGMAKSLDRSEKGRKCLFAAIGTGPSGKEEKGILGREEEFENLPMDFQSLLQSPENNNMDCFLRQNKTSQPQNQPTVQQPVSGNFIQCGTNITSSIWSTEKMEEDESLPWEEVGKYVGWSDARNSLLSSAWKLPFAYGNGNNNNNNDKCDKKDDIERTTLALKNEGAFFSLFNDNSNHLSLLKATNLGEKSDSIGKVEPPKKKLENLLTSMKTHFIPIKQEPVEVDAPTYNDGSSFFNHSSFEEVKYRRSESGSLFLGPDQKYMEFKRTDLTSTPAFVPKFRVSSNEKFCQTDDVPSEDDEPSIDQSDSKFFFPDDEHYAEEMKEIPSFSSIAVSGWVTTWPVAAPASDDIWSNDKQTWVVGADEKWRNPTEGAGKREDFTRLRHEITQEGEQLLSDIRYLLQDHRPKNGLLVGSSGL